MPYYDEYFRNIPAGGNMVLLNAIQPESPIIVSSGGIRTFRTQGPYGRWGRQVSDELADPYGWFLRGVRKSRERHPGEFPADFGHPVQSEKHEGTFVTKPVELNMPYGVTGITKNFQVWPNLAAEGDFPSAGSQARPRWLDDLANFGQTAIARKTPQSHAYSGAQFLGELREGLPSIIGIGLLKGRAKDVLRNTGSEYLNYQFGVAPLISDLTKICNVLLNVDSELKKLRDMQGKAHHVSMSLPMRYASREMRWPGTRPSAYLSNNASALYTPPISGASITPGVITTVSNASLVRDSAYYLATLETRRWFEGSVVSYFEFPDQTASFVDKAKALISMKMTPEVIWELSPWTWLIDWVFHIQSSIAANAVAGDESVVWNYSYVMEKSVFRQFFSGTLSSAVYSVVRPTPVSSTLVDTYFRRIRGNPFGFTASAPSGLNPSQLAILAALGLSR